MTAGEYVQLKRIADALEKIAYVLVTPPFVKHPAQAVEICMPCWKNGMQNEGRPCPIHDKVTT